MLLVLFGKFSCRVACWKTENSIKKLVSTPKQLKVVLISLILILPMNFNRVLDPQPNVDKVRATVKIWQLQKRAGFTNGREQTR